MNAQLMTRRQPIEPPVATPLPSIVGLEARSPGSIGGAAMIGSAALLAMSYGYDVWFQLKVVASVVLGPAAHATVGFDAIPVLVGLLVHLLSRGAAGRRVRDRRAPLAAPAIRLR